jgi:2-dehydro-3-deoxy-D-gluconate 5-dehydrogenase
MKMFSLQGRVALVTGGNGGIGLGIAEGLARAGARMVLSGRDKTKAESALAALRSHAGEAHFIESDVTDETACRALAATAVKKFGRLDILVNNAGINIRKRPEDLTAREWHAVIDTNLSAALFCAQAAYPQMQRQGGGKIINIGSMMSLFAAPYAAAYGASKGGIVQLSRSLATAWAADNIQVNAILPGWIDTNLTRTARQQVEGLHERVLARTPAGRWGEPGDFAGTAVFLASGASDFVTGAAIPVDGGYSIAA